HAADKPLTLYSTRPDGLFADQIASTDVMDMRHSVADKFDYDSILKTNLHQLLRGNLRTAWKRFGSTNTAGNIVLYGDRITDGTVSVGGLSRLDGPNGNRRAWSDSVITERYNIAVRVPSNSTGLSDPLQFSIAPYTNLATWSAAPPIHGPTNRLSGTTPIWWNGDQIRIARSTYYVGLPTGDTNQIRFVTPEEDPDAVLIHFEGMTTDPNGGEPLDPPETSPSSSNPVIADPSFPRQNRILKDG